MANLIQIKRSLNTGTTPTLANGELAYTANGDILFIGSNGATVAIGGKRVPGTLTANQALIANSTSGIDKIIVANLQPTSIYANSTLGTTGQVLHSNGTGVYWADTTADITSVVAGDGLTGGGSSGEVTLNVGAANGITVTIDSIGVDGANGISVDSSGVNVLAGTDGGLSVNSTGVWITAGNGLVTNSSGLHVGQGNGISVSADAFRVQQANGIAVDAGGVRVDGGSTITVNNTGVHVNTNLSITSLVTSGDVTVNGNTKLGDATTDVVSFAATVNTNITPSANITYDLGSNLSRWKNVYSSHIESTSGEFAGNLTVGGDLLVSGNVTTVNVSSLSVSDPLIKLAVNNTVSDALYIGFTGHYNGSGNTTNHAGLVRDPSDKDFYLFSTYGNETDVLNNIVNTADPSFTLANLNVYLLSGGLTTNATHVAITANSTVNVSIVANSITLTTPLAATSGGTGLNSYTSGDLLVANTSNVLSKLALGTDGYVLQSNGTAVVYGTLDGGTY